jgi:hypothetical protein
LLAPHHALLSVMLEAVTSQPLCHPVALAMEMARCLSTSKAAVTPSVDDPTPDRLPMDVVAAGLAPRVVMAVAVTARTRPHHRKHVEANLVVEGENALLQGSPPPQAACEGTTATG